MHIDIQPYEPQMIDAVKAFNGRLRQHQIPHAFPETPMSKYLPKTQGRKLYQEYFLALHNATVHGGYVLKHQEFSIDGKIIALADYQFPLSEGVIDKRYALVGIQLLSDALKRHALLMCLGVGGRDRPIVNMLERMRWSIRLVPFYFKIHRGYRFLRNIAYLRRTRLRQRAFDMLALLGCGGLLRLAQLCGAPSSGVKRHYRVEEVSHFSEWADVVWDMCKDHYALVAVRDSAILNILYPMDDARFIRLKIRHGAEVIGWAVLLDTPMSGHKQFGNMRVGSIVDCLALPEHADAVIRLATQLLEQRQVDLLLSNQAHHAWGAALRNAGFWQGPSNYVFAASPEVASLLAPFDRNTGRFHINRGDGDGPLHL
jgi:hypothetical protein